MLRKKLLMNQLLLHLIEKKGLKKAISTRETIKAAYPNDSSLLGDFLVIDKVPFEKTELFYHWIDFAQNLKNFA